VQDILKVSMSRLKPIALSAIFIDILVLIILISGCTGMENPQPTATQMPTGAPTQPTTTSPRAPTQSTTDIDQQIQDKLGTIIYNTPQTMTVGDQAQITVRITKNFTPDMTQNLMGSGTPQVQNISVGDVMGVYLTSDNSAFDITLINDIKNDNAQRVENTGVTEWDFEVTPLKPGNQKIYLYATIIVDGEPKSYLVFAKTFYVNVNNPRTLSTYLESNYQWIITTLVSAGVLTLGGTAGLIRWFGSRSKKPRP